MTDERKGLPSASHAWVDFNCQESRRMEQKAAELGQLPVEDPQWKERGLRVHESAESGDTSKLSGDEKRARDYVVGKADERAKTFGANGQFSEIKEFRFWLSIDGEDVYSGRVDRVRFFYFNGYGSADVLLQEYKPGFLAEWDMWAAQVEADAACVDSHLHSCGVDVASISAEIITRFHGIGTRRFERQDLDQAQAKILETLRLQKIETPVNPGPWCNRCAGRLICKASHMMIYPVGKDAFTQLPAGQQGAWVLSQVLKLKKTAQEIESYYRKQLASDADFLSGYFKLKQGQRVRKLEDVLAVWQRLESLLSQEEFLAACKITITELEEAYVLRQRALAALENRKLTFKSAHNAFNDRLADLIKWREDEPSLEWTQREPTNIEISNEQNQESRQGNADNQ